ncbi:MAG: hypothetical protein AAFU49_17625 [Pseudomonadota bacterium]
MPDGSPIARPDVSDVIIKLSHLHDLMALLTKNPEQEHLNPLCDYVNRVILDLVAVKDREAAKGARPIAQEQFYNARSAQRVGGSLHEAGMLGNVGPVHSVSAG